MNLPLGPYDLGPEDQDPVVCRQCGSSDVTYYSDQHSFCHSHGKYTEVCKESEFDYVSQEKRDRENLEQQRRLMG